MTVFRREETRLLSSLRGRAAGRRWRVSASTTAPVLAAPKPAKVAPLYSGPNMKATYKRGGDNDWDSEEGLWAIFKFFYTADPTVPAGGGYALEWVMRSGKDAKPVND